MRNSRVNFIVLEGPSGVGKTTLMRAIQKHIEWPAYRAFRSARDGHQPGSSEGWLSKLNVPVNTWQEDLFAADLLSVVKSNVILDRSMLSALTYEEMGVGSVTGLGPRERSGALGLWARRMVLGGGLIVMMRAPVRVCFERSKRFTLEHIEQERRLLWEYALKAQEYGADVCTTEGDAVEENARVIAQMVLNGSDAGRDTSWTR